MRRVILACAVLASVGAGSAWASTASLNSDEITYSTPGLTSPVQDIAVLIDTSQYGWVIGYQPNLPNGYTLGVGPSSITGGFAPGSFLGSATITGTFLVGVTSALAGDASGDQHLVVFGADAWAAAAAGQSFSSLFPDTSEATLIADLDDQGQGSYSMDLSTFANGDATTTGTDGSIAFGATDSFTAVAFSDGQVIGTGTSAPVPLSAVPEPASWVMMLAGLGLVGAAARRRAAARALATA